MGRLPHLALLVCALFAVVVGLFPSLLSIAAVIAVPLAILAIVGVAFPNVINQRPWLRRISVLGLIVFGAEFVIITGRLVATKRRSVELVVDGTSPRRVRVVYGVTNGASGPWFWTRKIIIPLSNVAYVRYKDNGGWYSANNPHPIRVMIRGVKQNQPRISASWVAGGYTEGGACHFEYDEYTLGNPSDLKVPVQTSQPHTGWLDSLNTWGVECRRGMLFRYPSGGVPSVRRTGSACYYLPDGSVTCSGSAPENKSSALAP